MIVFYDRNVYQLGKRKHEAVNVERSRDVEQLNILQVCSATENIYFQDQNLDMGAMFGKGKIFRQENEVKNRVMPLDPPSVTERRELVGTSRVDVSTNLLLSCISIKFSAKRWRSRFKKLKEQPMVVRRDEGWLCIFEEFEKKIERMEYTPGEFFKYLHDNPTKLDYLLRIT